MIRSRRTWPIVLLLAGLPAGAACGLLAVEPARPAAPARIVYVARQLADEDLLVLLSAAAAGEPAPVVLLETPATAMHLAGFLKRYQPTRVVPVSTAAEDQAEQEPHLGVPADAPVPCRSDEFWKLLFPQAERLVVCPAEPRGLLLHAACLAGAARAPLFVMHSKDEESVDVLRRARAWKVREILAVAGAVKLVQRPAGVKLIELPNEAAVSRAARRFQQTPAEKTTLVVANPADHRNGSGLSCLAPLLTAQRRAALLLTNAAGTDAADIVRTALKDPALRQADTLLLLGDLQAIPMERRTNPAVGKDKEIEMEPLTPVQDELFTLATGRLFHRDRGVVALTLARERLLAESSGPCKALVASNPGGSLPLLEMFSRHTAQELRNRGYQTTALFEHDVNPRDLRRELPDQDIFLWEGHYRTMVDSYGVPTWTEPLRPALIFLQSCLALNEAEAPLFVQRGAVAVVGSSTRIYSATGGAFALAFFEALLYDEQTLGSALRQAKNFLLAYSQLKQKRLGANARLTGANLRSAWAFTLWGDPSLKLPSLQVPRDALPVGRHEVRGNVIVFPAPRARYAAVTTDRYANRAWPHAHLAGLVAHDEDETARLLVPLQFAEVRLTPPRPGQTPHLQSRLADRNWVFMWDERRAAGYLLVIPPRNWTRDLRFEVRWE